MGELLRKTFKFNTRNGISDAVSIFLFTYIALIQVFGILRILFQPLILLSFIISIIISFYYSGFPRKIRKTNPFSRKNLRTKYYLKNPLQWVQLLSLACLIGATLFIALSVAPNNWDSMTYHLPRMEHWYQNHSLWFYNTNIDRQLWMQGLNSHLFLIFKALHLPEQSYNLVQWLSYICILFVSNSFLKEFKVSKKLRVTGILIIAAVPNIVVEAPTTQSDLLAALVLLLNFRYFILILCGNRLNSTFSLFGITFALATFAKGTLFPYLFMVSAIILWVSIRKLRGKHFVKALAFIPATISINLFVWLQSYIKFGSIGGPQSSSKVFLQSPLASEFSLTNVCVSFIHFLTTNFQSFFANLNSTIFRSAYSLGGALHLNLLSNGTAWPNWNSSNNTFTYIFQPSFGINEDSATSPQLIIIFFTLAFILVSKRSKLVDYRIYPSTVALIYFVSIIVILRWNPFVDRYFIPASVIGVCAVFIGVHFSKRGVVILAVLSLLGAIYALPFAFRSDIRPILGANSFVTNKSVDFRYGSRQNLPSDFDGLEKVIQAMRPSSLVIAIHGDDWEYPIWRLANLHKLKVIDYRDPRKLSGTKPLLVCYIDCLDSKNFKNQYILEAPISSKLSTNQKVSFSNPTTAKVLQGAWSTPEGWGIWSDGFSSSINFDVEPSFYKSNSIFLTVRTLVDNSVLNRSVLIEVNGKSFGKLNLNELGEKYEVSIPNNFLINLVPQKHLQIQFKFENLESPAELGLGNDTRKLGIGLYSLQTVSKS